MTECVIDVCGISYDSDTILTIAAIRFGIFENQAPELKDLETFYRRIKFEPLKDIVLNLDTENTRKWNSLDKELYYESLQNPDRIDLCKAMKEFKEFTTGCCNFWSNNIVSDTRILGNAFTKCEMKSVLDGNTVYDLKTLCKVMNLQEKINKNALPLQKCYDSLRIIEECLEKLTI